MSMLAVEANSEFRGHLSLLMKVTMNPSDLVVDGCTCIRDVASACTR